MLAMKPMAVACHRGAKRSVTWSRRSRYRQRMVRMGKTRVATMTHAAKGTTRAARMWAMTSARSMS